MIHWAWLIVAFLVGVLVGFFYYSLCEIQKHDDKKSWWEE